MSDLYLSSEVPQLHETTSKLTHLISHASTMSAIFTEHDSAQFRHQDNLVEEEERHRRVEEDWPQFRASDEYYNFPVFVIDYDSKEQMLKKVIPEMITHKLFDINDIIDGLYSSVDFGESVPRLIEEMMDGLMTSYISCVHDFKVFVLHVGLPESEVKERTQESCDFFVLKKPPIKTRSQVMKCLRKMRGRHHLAMMDPAVLWNMVVLSGCMMMRTQGKGDTSITMSSW